MFAFGDGDVGDGISDPAKQVCFTNDGKETTRFLPVFHLLVPT